MRASSRKRGMTGVLVAALCVAMVAAACVTGNSEAEGAEDGPERLEGGRLVGDSTYSVVDTGQTGSYGNMVAISAPEQGEPFFGQDGQVDGSQPNYADNGDGTVTDSVTVLTWQESPDTDGDGDIDAADKFTLSQAQAYPAQLNAEAFAGYTDWRLPTIKELYSLILFSGVDPSGYEGSDTSGLVPFIDSDYFDFAYGDTAAGERIIDAQYASITLYVSDEDGELLFGVNFADGRIKGYWTRGMGGEKTFYVICVRGNMAYGVNAFVDHGDGTISDEATGLMWAQADSGEAMNWEQALAYAQEMNDQGHLGYDDWRVPNVKELQSIVDYTRSPYTSDSAAIDPLFGATSITNEAGVSDYGFYWSSTTHLNWTQQEAAAGAYVAFGRSMGYMGGRWRDVHGAGSQRSDPKQGDASEYPTGRGPQGDAIRIDNLVRLVRDADALEPSDENAQVMLPLCLVP